jgi:hypothetical protein
VLGRHRDAAQLERRAEQDHVGQQVVAEDGLGDPLRRYERDLAGNAAGAAGSFGDGALEGRDVRRKGSVRPPGRQLQHGGGRGQLGVDDDDCLPGADGGLQDVAGQVEVCLAVAHGRGAQASRGAGQAQVRHDGPGLLRQARLVQPADRQAGRLAHRGHDPVRGHHAGAADAGDIDAVPPADDRRLRGRQDPGGQAGGRPARGSHLAVIRRRW